MWERLGKLSALIRAAKAAPLFGKAALAEQAIELAHGLLAELVARVEQLEKSKPEKGEENA